MSADEDDYEEDSCGDEQPQTCYKNGKPRVLSRQCATCIFRPGNPMHLNAGRLKDMCDNANREGSQGIICHDTLTYGGYPEYGGALCRGYYDSMGHLNNFVRIMERLGGFEEIPPPGEADGTL